VAAEVAGIEGAEADHALGKQVEAERAAARAVGLAQARSPRGSRYNQRREEQMAEEQRLASLEEDEGAVGGGAGAAPEEGSGGEEEDELFQDAAQEEGDGTGSLSDLDSLSNAQLQHIAVAMNIKQTGVGWKIRFPPKGTKADILRVLRRKIAERELTQTMITKAQAEALRQLANTGPIRHHVSFASQESTTCR